ncbi:hypothetical protein ACSS6W_003968 [Trichoderma asperelloides]
MEYDEHRCRDSSTFSSSRGKKFVHQRGVSRFDYIRRLFKINKKSASCSAKHCVILPMNAAPEMIFVMGRRPF